MNFVNQKTILTFTTLKNTVLNKNSLSEELQTNPAFKQKDYDASYFREKDVINILPNI